MDFARINPARDAEKAATYHVEYDDEALYHEGKPIEMDFLGVDSPAGKRAGIRHAKRLAALQPKGKKERSIEDYSEDEIADRAAKVTASSAKFYAEMMTGWRNLPHIPSGKLYGKAELLEYTPEAALDLLQKAEWLHAGIDAFLANKANWRKSGEAA
jgi:hypothetical protein